MVFIKKYWINMSNNSYPPPPPDGNTRNYCLPVVPRLPFKAVLLALFLAALRAKAPGLEIALTGAEFAAGLKPEYTASLYYCFSGELSGTFEFNHRLTVAGGVSLGQAGGILEAAARAGAEYALPLPGFLPLYLNAAYVFQGLPDYNINTHTVLTLLSLRYKWAGFYAGPAFRFSRFFGTESLYERVPSFLVYINFFNTENLRIGIGAGTLSAFEANNLGSYSVHVYNRIRITSSLSLANDLELPVSGSIARIISVYGAAFKTGVVYKW
jgi:hypothetical protein